MQKKNTAKRQLKPTAEQKSTARILSLLYAGELDVRGGLVHRTTLYLNRLLRDTGTPQKGRPRHELYLEAVTKPGANMTYDSWVQPLAREVWEQHESSVTARVRKRLALTYTGRPNQNDMAAVNALLGFTRFMLTLMPARLDLAQTIYRASVEAWRASRKQYKDDCLPGRLDEIASGLHIQLIEAIGDEIDSGNRKFMEKSRRAREAWFGETSSASADETPAAAPDEMPSHNYETSAPVVDLSLWVQSHPRPIRNLVFAEKQ